MGMCDPQNPCPACRAAAERTVQPVPSRRAQDADAGRSFMSLVDKVADEQEQAHRRRQCPTTEPTPNLLTRPS